jgi:hypothetical protein
VYIIEPPTLAAISGHARVTVMAGAIVTPQVEEMVFETGRSVQISLADPVKAAVTEQRFAGIV